MENTSKEVPKMLSFTKDMGKKERVVVFLELTSVDDVIQISQPFLIPCHSFGFRDLGYVLLVSMVLSSSP